MNTTYVHRHDGTPYLIIKGVNTAITADIYTFAGAQQTPSAGTIEIHRGADSTEVVAASTAITSTGPPASYTVTAATTSALTVDPSERWRVIWSLTIGGTEYKFADRPAFLVDFDVWANFIDTDMTDADPALSQYTGTQLANFQGFRLDALADTWRDLYRHNIHPAQVTDGGYWRELTFAKAMELTFRAGANSLNDPQFRERAEYWAGRYADVLTSAVDYDADADGAADDSPATAAPTGMDPYAERPRVG